MSETKSVSHPDQHKGWLHKWTNYIKGYQKRWFVLANGHLSYYRSQNDVSSAACRGIVNLANAFIHTPDSCSFVISNRGSMTFHLKASSEVERQRWVTALELAKAKAITIMENDEEENMIQPDKLDLQNDLKSLGSKLEDMKTCCDLIGKHGAALQRALIELERLDNPTEAATKLKTINERASVFRITSTAMISACTEYQSQATTQGARWQKLLHYEHEHRVSLEEMLEQLGKQHSHLEKQIRRTLSSGPRKTGPEPDEDDDDFYDAMEDQAFEIKSPAPPVHGNGSGISLDSMLQDPTLDSDTDLDKFGDDASHNKSRKTKTPLGRSTMTEMGVVSMPVVTSTAAVRQRRKVIPERPNYSINLWSIMKNCIGKELSKIPMPVNFSEPISFVQRLTEDFEYSDCLDRAAACDDSCLQLAYVAAFTVSSYANTTLRTGKPFNPLLGETFECDRYADLGWRSFAEQVSHHPPTVAMYTEGRDWTSWQEFTMSSKFRGKYLQIVPMGIAHLLFRKTGNHYTWRKVTTTVNNIIVGTLWVDNHGEMDIVNHKTGDQCHLKYYAYSYFSKDLARKVSGLVCDASETARYVLTGTWDEKMECAKVEGKDESSKVKAVYETKEPFTVWQRRYPPPELSKCYNFTLLAVELNEPEDGVAPTDSRNRPDQRLMEEGKWDEANKVKVMLEDKQRQARKERDSLMEAAAEEGGEYHGYEPKWFKKENDPQTGNLIHQFTNEYWTCKQRQDWARCPDIYI